MEDKAWKTLEGLYDLCYNKLGLAFQMPESLLKSNVYRSLGYMRPLCIWSIQYAVDNMNNSSKNELDLTQVDII